MDNEDYEPGAGNIADTAHQLARQAVRTRVVGQKERRVDARPLVTGAPVYAAEQVGPGSTMRRAIDGASELVIGMFRAGAEKL